MARINCFIPFANAEQALPTIENLKANDLVNKIYLLANNDSAGSIDGCEIIKVSALNASSTMQAIAQKADADYVMLYTKYDTLKFAPFAIERFVKLADDSNSGMMYADHYNVTENGADKAPVIDYQFG